MSIEDIRDRLQKLQGNLTFADLVGQDLSAAAVFGMLPAGVPVTFGSANLNLSGGTLTVTTAADWGSGLSGLKFVVTVTANLSANDDYPTTVTVQAPESLTLKIPGIDWFDLEQFTFSGHSTHRLSPATTATTAEASLSAILHAGKLVAPIDVKASAAGLKLSFADQASAAATGPKSAIPGIDDALAVFGAAKNSINLPPTVQQLMNFLLNDLEVSFDPAQATVANIALTFSESAASGSWPIIPEVISLDSYQIVLNVADPLNAQQVTGRISGGIKLGSVPINVAADHPATGAWKFEGPWSPDSKTAINDIVSGLAQQFGIQLPGTLLKFTLRDFSFQFDTETFTAVGTFYVQFDVNDSPVELSITATLEKQASGYTADLKGKLAIGTAEFDVEFDSETDDVFTATWSDPANPLTFADIAAKFGWADMPAVPANLDLSLTSADFSYDFSNGALVLTAQSVNYGALILASKKSQGDGRFYVVAVEVPTEKDIDLSNLPVVGDKLPDGGGVGIKDLQVIIASADLNTDSVSEVNALLPNQGNDGKLLPATLTKGPTLAATLHVLTDEQTLTVALASDSKLLNSSADRRLTTAAASVGAAASDYQPDATWFTIGKTFGPVSLRRIGLQYQNSVLSFLFDAALAAGGLTLSLDDLSIGSPLTKFDPQFSLRGLGVDYSNGGIEIGGAFLRVEVNENGQQYTEYDGGVIIKTSQLNLSAMGSYAKVNGYESLFIYGVLNYPFGGPPFFFVTGLAAGFGYNRALMVPPIESVAQFPLIREAVAGSGPPNDLTAELQTLHDYIPATLGGIFFAVGVKFTSFKLIDSFALLAFIFGTQFEIDVLGLSTLIVPTPEEGKSVTPLAEVQMALRASFIPAQGFLGVSAQLTSASYVFSKDCHLTGGFAFYSWFSGDFAGDFVQTLGGYHPSFDVPPHYPQVPRLALNWQVDDHVSIKGELYYALTASALMAGGSLQATWSAGDLKAWFNAGADFLIAWKPYHYDAHIYVDMGVSYTFSFFGRHTISVDVGADLHVWGPEFQGTAHIHLWIVSFDVSFGPNQPQTPQPIDWPTFKSSFLPADTAICTIAVKSGLVRKLTNDPSDLGIINPKDLVIVTNSVIPSNQATCDNQTPPGDFTRFGVGPVGVKSDQLTSNHTVTIARADGAAVDKKFVGAPVLKKVPAGLWGDSLLPVLNAPRFIADAFSGFEIRPATPVEPVPPDARKAIDRTTLQYSDPDTVANAFGSASLPGFSADLRDDEKRKADLSQTLVNNPGVADARAALIKALAIDVEIDLSPAAAGEFLVAPQIQSAAS